MGLFDHFPYTNFHELNLDWILQMLQKIDKTMNEFVAINALKYADPIQWNITSQYEKNTIVIDPQSGTAYISVQPVPVGVTLTDTDYWAVVFDLEQFVTKANGNFTVRVEEQTTDDKKTELVSLDKLDISENKKFLKVDKDFNQEDINNRDASIENLENEKKLKDDRENNLKTMNQFIKQDKERTYKQIFQGKFIEKYNYRYLFSNFVLFELFLLYHKLINHSFRFLLY